MRFIDRDEIKVKPSFRDLLLPLAEAQAAVNQEKDPSRRSELIKKYRPRWVALRKVFSEQSYGKCWYTESLNPGTDDDVDHYRPKGPLEDGGKKHPGYYWLAFDWTNLRLSCHRANRPRKNPDTGTVGGKSNHFPLVDPRTRAYGEDDDLSKEEPVLLDPVDMFDVSLLTFNVGGEAALESKYKDDPVAQLRVQESIRLYHLNWPRFLEDRLVLFNRIERLVSRGSRQAPSESASIRDVTQDFKDTLKDLKELIAPRSEYSSAARSYVELFSHEWWIRDIVLKVAG